MTSAPGNTPLPTPGDSARWIHDPALAQRLSDAVALLLDGVDGMLEDDYAFPQALAGGGLWACEHSGIDLAWAPLIEAETARLVAAETTGQVPGLFSPDLPTVITVIGAQPLDVQQALVRRATSRHLHRPPLPTPRQIRAVVHDAASPRAISQAGPHRPHR